MRSCLPRLTLLLPLALLACGGDETDPGGASGSGAISGSSGQSGKGGGAGAGGAGEGGGGSGGQAGAGNGGAGAGQGGAGQGGAGAGGDAGGGGEAGAGGAGAGGDAGASGAGTGGASGEAGSGGAGTGGSAGGGGEGGISGSSGQAGAGGACVASTQEAKLEKLPVDVMVYIDSSPTMAPALAAVEKNIDENLANKMASSALDYRVIVLAAGKVPKAPGDPSRWYHYENGGGSGALHENLLNWYNLSAAGNKPPGGYSDWVRDESFKVFLVISDTSSGPTMDGAEFDQKLLALQPARFGTAEGRKYRYHAIVGLKENDPASAPWPPSAPVVGSTCTGYGGALAPGENAQEVAILTGGLRFPLCQFDQYDVVFSTIAEGIAKTTPVTCEFVVPKTPEGKLIDPNTILLDYTPGSGAPQTFTQSKDLFACKPDQFYIENDTVKLCPAACQLVQADPGARIDLTYGCDVGFKP